jgi:hypothetical protein
MSDIIKTLEIIGQNTSLNQYDSLNEMLIKLQQENKIEIVLKTNNDLVCGLFREDEDDNEDDDKEKK